MFYKGVILCVCAAFSFSHCEGAPKPPLYMKEFHDALGNLRYTTDNCEAQLNLIQEKLHTQEDIAEALYREHSQSQKQMQELVKSKTASLEQRLNGMEAMMPMLQADIGALKGHLEKQTAALSALQSKFGAVEEMLVQNGQATQHLQQAMQALTKAMQQEIMTAQTVAAVESKLTYNVQQGDSLERIARRHSVTVRAIKEANGLASDKIRVGQPLAIPQ